MIQKKVLSALFLALIIIGANAQEPKVKVKIVDTNNVTTIIDRVTTSSSSSCMTADFPVYQGKSLTEVSFSDLKKVIVLHDKPAEDDLNYISIELVTKNGESDVFEMIRNIRFTGETEYGNFSVKVKDIKSVEIMD